MNLFDEIFWIIKRFSIIVLLLALLLYYCIIISIIIVEGGSFGEHVNNLRGTMFYVCQVDMFCTFFKNIIFLKSKAHFGFEKRDSVKVIYFSKFKQCRYEYF